MQYAGIVAKSSATPIPFALPATGLTVTVTVRKPGGVFAASAGSVAEIANKLYQYTPTSTETDTEGKLTLYGNGGSTNVDLVTVDVVTFGTPATPTDIYDYIHTQQPGTWDKGTALASLLGPGDSPCTLTFNDEDAQPIAEMRVWISTDSLGNNVITGQLPTSDDGTVTFLLNAGVDYFYWTEINGKLQSRGVAFPAVPD